MNNLTIEIHRKGYTLIEFLLIINKGRDWYYKHSNGGKDNCILSLAIKGIEKK